MMNAMNPEILETDEELAFRLAYQRLIEMIRSERVLDALEFAHEDLVPRCERNVKPSLSHPRFLSHVCCL
jgi:hypothetical protein